MKITVKDVGEFEVKDISYSEARTIHRENTKIFWGKTETEINPDQYYDLLEKVKKLSGVKESDFKGLSMVEVDSVLQQILMEYTGLNPKT